MRHETYKRLKNAYMGHVDKTMLYQAVAREKDPFLHRAVQLITAEHLDPLSVPWDTSVFTNDFRKAAPKERLHQTVMVYLLRLAVIIKGEIHIRTFKKPESHKAVEAWKNLLKQNIFAVLTLLYNPSWNMETVFEKLDNLVIDLVFEGKASALREFMNKHLNIPVPITLAEQMFEKLNFLNIGQFGSSFWRLLHWMAEAMDTRQNTPDILYAKRIWRELVTEPLYRLLQCSICMTHMHAIVQELKPQLLDEKLEQRKLWFNIHNRVTATKFDRYVKLGIPAPNDWIYTESKMEEDSEFMRQALLP